MNQDKGQSKVSGKGQDTHQIFVGTGNANPDLDGLGQPGDNLFTNSVI